MQFEDFNIIRKFNNPISPTATRLVGICLFNMNKAEYIEKYGEEAYAKHCERVKLNNAKRKKQKGSMTTKTFNLMIEILDYEQVGFVMENFYKLKKYNDPVCCSFYWANPDNDFNIDYYREDNKFYTKSVLYIWDLILKDCNIEDPVPVDLPFK